MQFRMTPHKTKEGKHESNTSDVLLFHHRIGNKRKERQDQYQWLFILYLIGSRHLSWDLA